MSGSRTIDLTLVVNRDKQSDKALLVSDTGEEMRAFWLPRSETEIIAAGKTTRGTDRNGQMVTLPLIEVRVPEWLAKDKGLV